MEIHQHFLNNIFYVVCVQLNPLMVSFVSTTTSSYIQNSFLYRKHIICYVSKINEPVICLHTIHIVTSGSKYCLTMSLRLKIFMYNVKVEDLI